VSWQSSILGGLLLLALASPVWAAAVRCTTDEEQTLQRWHTMCDDGTRAVSRYHRILDRWETTITASPRPSCIARMNPRTQQVDVRCW
jgi:hypothetical protein